MTDKKSLNTEQDTVDVASVASSQSNESQTEIKENSKMKVDEPRLNKSAKNKKADKDITAAKSDDKPTETVVIKKSNGLAWVAILLTLGLGGGLYYHAHQFVAQTQHKMSELETQLAQAKAAAQPEQHEAIDLSIFDQEKIKIAQLEQRNQDIHTKIDLLERHLADSVLKTTSLQTEVARISNSTKSPQQDEWLLAEADFLLTNALRKLVLDNDVDTSVSLLKVAAETLAKVADSRAVPVRAAINSDLKLLLSLNRVDQNAIMQRLSQLANNLDELVVLNVNFDDSATSDTPSDSLDDWRENVEKSANSFLNHFIRITPKNADQRELLAPNQDIYLRENIRLRLQLALMAVPRQQNELYKQSIETVASWVRSYFDTSSEGVQNYLKQLDELAEQSIYIDVPDQLSSLTALDQLLNKSPVEVQKIELNVDKSVTATSPSNDAEATTAPAATKQ